METLHLNTEKKEIEKAGEILKNGGIVAFPTDTVYGLGAIYSDREAVKKIFIAKGRDEGKPLSILVSQAAQIKQLVREVSKDAEKLIEAFWPGALTIILEKSDAVPSEVSAGGNTVGIRMPSDETARSLITAAGSPLAAPSANISGKRSSVTFADVEEDLEGRIDAAIDGGECNVKVASTVLDLTGEKPVILREGVITKEMIDEVLR